MSPAFPSQVLVTGATGYVGGLLVRVLVERGVPVRCLVRDARRASVLLPSSVEISEGDLFDPAAVRAALTGIRSAYYLVHSLDREGDFETLDRTAARQFGEAAREAGLRRIVYLGGLGETSPSLSPHLRSRHEVGEVLRESGVEVVELRASVVLGAGSLSFEMIRALVERLPVMVTPRWVSTPTQPIGAGDLVRYLVEAIELPSSGPRVLEIGCKDRVSYGELMREYARRRGLRRGFVSVPFLTPHLSSLWLGLVTPFRVRAGRRLVDSLRSPTIVRSDAARQAFGFEPLTVREAVAEALRREDAEIDRSRWGSAWRTSESPPYRMLDRRSIDVPASPSTTFAVVERIGGKNGWYHADWLWRIRGVLDRLVGGPGLRRGRRDPDHVVPGDVLDFWRVTDAEPGRHLRLQAEMKIPGRAWLDFEVEPAAGGSRVHQTAMFDPRGVFGRAYWFALVPLHSLVFGGLLRAIARRAVAMEGAGGPAPMRIAAP